VKRAPIIALGVAVLLVAGGSAWWQRTGSSAHVAATGTAGDAAWQTQPAAGQPADPAPPSLPAVAPPALPDSFLTVGLRHRLEALLLEAGPADTPQALKQRLAALVARHFPAEDAVRATQLLDRYVDYRVALAGLGRPADMGDPAALRTSLDERRRLRERHFDAQEYQALFADEEELDRFTVERLEIQRNPGLDAAQKQAALRQAESGLGESQRAARSEAVLHLELAAQTAGFEAAGATAHERHLQRRAAYGDPAAHRLAQLDREEQDWQQRLAQFAAAQARQASAQELQGLKEQLFSPQEQLRLEAALALRAPPGEQAR